MKNNVSNAEDRGTLNKFESLDGLRAIACIGIVLMHVLYNITITPTENWLTNNVIGYMADFVFLFMMISAFSMSCGYYDRFKSGRISLNSFYKKRYRRVLPFFALLVGIDILQTFVLQGFKEMSVIYAELCESFADLTLVFGLLPDADITVIGVGWFLGVIFLFYMLFPFFIFLIESKRRALLVLALAIIWYFVGDLYFAEQKGTFWFRTNILYVAPYFIAGGLIYLYREWFVTRVKATGILQIGAIAYTIFFFSFPEYRIPLLSDLALYSLWLISAIAENGRNRKWTLLKNPVTKFLSNISMEIYLCHMMFVRIVERLHIDRLISDNDLYYWTICTLVLGASICFSLIWKQVERRWIDKN